MHNNQLSDKNINKNKAMDLEQVVHLTNKIGVEYAQAKAEAERLDLLKPCVRAQIALDLEKKHCDVKVSETKLKRLTEASSEYVDFIEKLASAKAKCDQMRIRYDSYKTLFDARRSQLSYKKAEMSIL